MRGLREPIDSPLATFGLELEPGQVRRAALSVDGGPGRWRERDRGVIAVNVDSRDAQRSARSLLSHSDLLILLTSPREHHIGILGAIHGRKQLAPVGCRCRAQIAPHRLPQLCHGRG